jgi:hypothetical protein
MRQKPFDVGQQIVDSKRLGQHFRVFLAGNLTKDGILGVAGDEQYFQRGSVLACLFGQLASVETRPACMTS